MSRPAPAVPTSAPVIAPDLRRLVEGAPDGVFIADTQGRYLYVNQAGCRLLGMQADEILGKTIFDLIPEADATRLRASERVMREGSTHVGEWALRHKDGHWVPVEVSANILPDGQWQVKASCGSCSCSSLPRFAWPGQNRAVTVVTNNHRTAALRSTRAKHCNV